MAAGEKISWAYSFYNNHAMNTTVPCGDVCLHCVWYSKSTVFSVLLLLLLLVNVPRMRSQCTMNHRNCYKPYSNGLIFVLHFFSFNSYPYMVMFFDHTYYLGVSFLVCELGRGIACIEHTLIYSHARICNI